LPVVLWAQATGIVEGRSQVESGARRSRLLELHSVVRPLSYCINGAPLCALRDKPRWFMHDGTPRGKRGSEGPASLPSGVGYATHAVYRRTA
jgi:hypothetical protein